MNNKITSLKELQEIFNIEYIKTPNKHLLIEIELDNIKNYLNFDVTSYRRSLRKKYKFSTPQENHIFKIPISLSDRKVFAKEVRIFNINNEALNLDKTESSHKKFILKQAFEFSKYMNWLRELKSNRRKQIKSNLNLQQKLLALHFLGLQTQDYTNIHIAEIIADILGMGSENIRKNLSNLYGGKNNIRNLENLEKLLEVFENETFENIKVKIKKEIKSLS